MATNWLEIKPSPNAIKAIEGWVDKNTGEILVSAYGYFKPPYDDVQAKNEVQVQEVKLKQEFVKEDLKENQSITYTPIEMIELNKITLDTPTKWKLIEIGTLYNPSEKPISIGFTDIETENYNIRLSGKNKYPQGDNKVAVYIKRTENSIDEFLIAEEIIVNVDEKPYTTELMVTVDKG